MQTYFSELVRELSVKANQDEANLVVGYLYRVGEYVMFSVKHFLVV